MAKSLIFCKKLKMLRQERHMAQIAVASSLGIERSTYSYYELGTYAPPTDRLLAISKLYQVSCDFLLDDTILPSQSNIEISRQFFLSPPYQKDENQSR